MKNKIVRDLLILFGICALSVGGGFLWSWPVGLMIAGGICLAAGLVMGWRG